MELVTLKQFAQDREVTYEAVRRMVAKYADEDLKGHIITKDGIRYLDEEAVAFLKDRRRASPVVVKIENHGDELEQLKKELEEERAKYKALQEKMELAQKQIVELQAERITDLEQISELKDKALLSANTEARAALLEEQHEADRRQIEENQKQIEELRTEAASYTPWIFGLYRKTK